MKNLEPTTQMVTRHCPICNDDKLFKVYINNGLSKEKLKVALLTMGISIIFTGITGEKVYVCSNCSHAEAE
jgi:hypothetical protein